MMSPASKALIEDIFLGKTVSQELPVIHATCGIPGAGKTTFVDLKLKNRTFPSNAFILNPDRVMAVLPEFIDDKEKYGAQKAYEKWEMPCRDLAYELAERAIAQRSHIIKDMGCVRPENLEMLQRIKQSGYALHIHYIECDIETAKSRVHQRDFQISDNEIHARHESLQNILPQYRMFADSFAIYTNTHSAELFKKSA